jgi:hypothetical protein
MLFDAMLKPSRLQYAPGLLLLVLLCTTVASAATGTVLADFIPGGKLGNGKGLAFDGTYLYYTINDDSNIYKITTKGALVATIPIQGGAAQGGPLAYGGGTLWTMNWANSSYVLYRINPVSGSVTGSCDISAANPGSPAVTSYPLNIGNSPDGLEWDGTSLWINGDAFSGNFIAQVNSSCQILRYYNAPTGLGTGGGLLNGTQGIAFDGIYYWHGTPSNGRTQSMIFQTDLSGARTGLHFLAIHLEEDEAFDPVTFAPACALWGNEPSLTSNHITAYEIPCPVAEVPGKPQQVCDVNGDGLINNDDLLAILSALNTHVLKNDPRDADGDGAVTIKDARLCALKCSAGYCGW